jgi:hypothetical protein
MSGCQPGPPAGSRADQTGAFSDVLRPSSPDANAEAYAEFVDPKLDLFERGLGIPPEAQAAAASAPARIM